MDESRDLNKIGYHDKKLCLENLHILSQCTNLKD